MAVSRTIIAGIWVAFFHRVPAIIVRPGSDRAQGEREWNRCSHPSFPQLDCHSRRRPDRIAACSTEGPRVMARPSARSTTATSALATRGTSRAAWSFLCRRAGSTRTGSAAWAGPKADTSRPSSRPPAAASPRSASAPASPTGCPASRHLWAAAKRLSDIPSN